MKRRKDTKMAKRNFLFVMIGIAIVSCAFQFASAESEPIDLIPVAVEEPEAVPDPRPVTITEHTLDKDDIEKLARLLWSSPLRAEEEKKTLCYVVMNRAAYGEPFADTVQGCINVHEFHFFDAHAHRSEENLRIAKEAMNEWLSRKDGNNVGKVIPLNAYYIQFTGEGNRHIRLLDADMLPLWR